MQPWWTYMDALHNDFDVPNHEQEPKPIFKDCSVAVNAKWLAACKHIGHVTPDGVQRLLNSAEWSASCSSLVELEETTSVACPTCSLQKAGSLLLPTLTAAVILETV